MNNDPTVFEMIDSVKRASREANDWLGNLTLSEIGTGVIAIFASIGVLVWISEIVQKCKKFTRKQRTSDEIEKK